MYLLALSLRSVMGWTVSPKKIGHGPKSWCPWIWPYLTMEPLQILSNKMKSLGQSQFSLTNGLTGRGGNLDTQRENTLWWQGQRLEWCPLWAKGHQELTALSQAMKKQERFHPESHSELDPADTWLSDFWPLEMWENFCCFKLLSLWNFVTTALAT